jgi:hypothetical protein
MTTPGRVRLAIPGCARSAITMGHVGLVVPGCAGLATTSGCVNLLLLSTASPPSVLDDETFLRSAPIYAPPCLDFPTTSLSIEYPGLTISQPMILLTLPHFHTPLPDSSAVATSFTGSATTTRRQFMCTSDDNLHGIVPTITTSQFPLFGSSLSVVSAPHSMMASLPRHAGLCAPLTHCVPQCGPPMV